MIAKIYDVTKIEVGFTFMDMEVAPLLIVSAEGRVNSGGWSNPELGSWIYIVQPADGIIDLDFYAEPPSSGTIVTAGFVSVRAHLLLPIPLWVSGVRVHASSNAMESKFREAFPPKGAKSVDTLPVPWPFPWFTPEVAKK